MRLESSCVLFSSFVFIPFFEFILRVLCSYKLLFQDWGDGDGARVAHMRPQNYTYFKATPYEEGSTKSKILNFAQNTYSQAFFSFPVLKVEVDKRASMAWLKRHLESFVGVPCDYFKVVKSNDEYDYTSLSPSFRDGDKINVRLGRALRKGEYLGKVFKLTPNDPDVSHTLLFNLYLYKNPFSFCSL